jgi:hypothetical protein
MLFSFINSLLLGQRVMSLELQSQLILWAARPSCTLIRSFAEPSQDEAPSCKVDSIS